MGFLTKLFAKEKKLQVEFCEKNLDRFLKKEHFADYQNFLNQKKVNYKEYECQSHCEKCKQSPYAIVNGDFIAADDMNQLLDKLKQGKKK